MEWLEVNQLSKECKACQEKECYNCDYAGNRWHLSKTEELIIRRKRLVKALERIHRQIDTIDKELFCLADQQGADSSIKKEE